MRPTPNDRIEPHRLVVTCFESPPDSDHGAFEFPIRGKWLRVISSGVDLRHGWEHVSVSLANRCPTWAEMQYVKELFWTDEETVVQFHPPADRYVNHNPNCLHLWRPLGQTIELPPLECI